MSSHTQHELSDLLEKQVKNLNKRLVSDRLGSCTGTCVLYVLLCPHTQDELSDLSEQQMKHLYGHAGSITALSFTPDQQMLLSASTDGTVRLWTTQWHKNLAAYKCVGLGVPGLDGQQQQGKAGQSRAVNAKSS